MLTLVLGRAKRGKTSFIMNQMKENIASGKDGNFILVPEQYSHTSEKELLARIGNHAAAFCEVVSFSRLNHKLKTIYGGVALPTVTEGGKVLSMYQALKELSGNLKVFQALVGDVRFISNAVHICEEFRGNGITAEQLTGVDEQNLPALSAKLQDLSFIYATYEGKLKGVGYSAADQFDLLIERIKTTDYFRGKTIFIDNFVSFNKQETDVIHALSEKAEVYLCLPMDESNEAQFETVKVTRNKFFDAKVVTLNKKSNYESDALSYLEENLFDYEAEKFDKPQMDIRVIHASNTLEELKIVAAEVLRLVREKGLRYRDIAVCCRNLAAVSDEVLDTFLKYDIPVYLSRSTLVSSRPVAAFLLSALELLSYGFTYENMLKYLKSGFSGIEREAVYEFENYLFLYNIGDKKWIKNEDFIENPITPGAKLDDSAKEKLNQINQTRRTVYLPLLKLKKAFSEKTAGAMVDGIFDFFEEVNLQKQLSERMGFFEQEEDFKTADEYRQSYEILVSVLEETKRLLVEEKMEARELCQIFKLILSKYDIETIPQTIDRVLVTSMDRFAEGTVKAAVIFGADDTELPAPASEDAILSDIDREKLLELGVKLNATSKFMIYDELNIIYRAFTHPRKYLTVTYPSKKLDKTKTRPSFVVKRICELFTDVWHTYQKEELIASKKTAILACGMDNPLRESVLAAISDDQDAVALIQRAQKAKDITRGPVLDKENIKEMFLKNTELSSTKFESYHSCRFAYFMRYALCVEKLKPLVIDGRMRGNFVHYGFENVLQEITEKDLFGKLTEEELYRLCQQCYETYIKENFTNIDQQGARFEYLFGRLPRLLYLGIKYTYDELMDSNFRPIHFELGFGKNHDIQSITVRSGEGNEISVKGVVDRVDIRDTAEGVEIRIIDYKTGRKRFQMKEVKNGLGSQLFIYLFALLKTYQKEVIPEGVYYAPVVDKIFNLDRPQDVYKERIKELKFSGHQFKAEEEIGEFETVITELLGNALDGMSKGDNEANPYTDGVQSSACDYCDYKNVCHFDEELGTDKKRYLQNIK